MSFRQRLADWIHPAGADDLHETKGRLANAQIAIDEMSRTHERHQIANEHLVNKLSDAADSLGKVRGHRKTLRETLMMARAYAMDAYDDEMAKLDKLPASSKKRTEQAAVVEAIKADLKDIADALSATVDP